MVIIGFLLIYSIYLFGKFLAAILSGIHEDHVFLGFGKHPAITFRIKNLKISIGLFIPLPWLAKFYKYKEGSKDRHRFEWEFFEQPVSKRLIVTLGGFLSMIVASIIIFSVLEYQKKDTYISGDELNKHGIYPSALAREKGFKKGDKIISVNGNRYQRLQDLYSSDVLLADTVYYEVTRGEDSLVINLGSNFIDEFAASSTEPLFSPNVPFKISGVISGSPAEISGFKENDIILKVEGIKISSLLEFGQIIEHYAGDSVIVTVNRDGNRLSIATRITLEGKLGFFSKPIIEYTNRHKTLLEAIGQGLSNPYKFLVIQLNAFQRIFTGNASQSLRSDRPQSGPIGIANLFDNDVVNFFRISALLLTLTAFYDILPLPKSSFLKCVPLLIESVFNKKVSYKAYINLQRLIWLPIILLMIGSIITDLAKLL